MRTKSFHFLRGFLLLCLFFPLALAGQAILVQVNTTDDTDDGSCDSEHCSLREAINAVQGQAFAQINFNIPGEADTFRIEPTRILPFFSNTQTLVIDGTSQPNQAEIIIANEGFRVTNVSDQFELYGLTFENAGVNFTPITITQSVIIGRITPDGVVQGNRFSNTNGIGLAIQAVNAEVIGNTFSDNIVGISVNNGQNNVIIGENGVPLANNTFINNEVGIAIPFDDRVSVFVYGNQFNCNQDAAILYEERTGVVDNQGTTPPTVTFADAGRIEGTSDPFNYIQVYLTDKRDSCFNTVPCQGNQLLATTFADQDGNWSIFAGEDYDEIDLGIFSITATQTQNPVVVEVRSSLVEFGTSPFSACFTACTELSSVALSQDRPNCAGDTFRISPILSFVSTPVSNDPLQFSWSGPRPYTSSDSIAIATQPGLYSLTVTNSCSSVSASRGVQPLEAAPDSINAGILNGGCEGDPLDLFADANDNLIYSWTGPLEFSSSQPSPSISSAAIPSESGQYILQTRTIELGCPGPGDTVNVTITQRPTAIPTSIESCLLPGQEVAVFNLRSVDDNIRGGDNTTTVLWFEDDGLEIPIEQPEQYTPVNSSVFAVVEAPGGCRSDVIQIPLVVEPNPSIFLGIEGIPTCTNPNGGIVFANVSQGTQPFQFNWDGFESTESTLFDLGQGIYSVTVTDANGCMASSEIVLEAPDTIDFQCSVFQDVSATGGQDGAILISYNTALEIPPQLSWSGPVQGSKDGLSTVADTIIGLPAGTYIVTVTDPFDGCVSTCEVTITEPACETDLGLQFSVTPVSCAGFFDGAIQLFPTAGTPPYQYEWGNEDLENTDSLVNLFAGTYSVTVTDANGCTQIETIEVTEPPSLVIDCSVVQNSSGIADGAAEIAVGGGTAAYLIFWINFNGEVPLTDSIFIDGPGTVPISGLAPGTYFITVRDGNNCEETCTITINEPDCTDFGVEFGATDATCPGAANGSLFMDPFGGVAPFNYDWNVDAFDGLSGAETLPAGDYVVIVTDSLGCTDTVFATVGEPDPFQIICQQTQSVSEKGASDGIAGVTVSGARPPYNLEFRNLDRSPIFIPSADSTVEIGDLAAGRYTIDIIDEFGCRDSCSFTITEPGCARFIDTLIVSDEFCPGARNGRIEVITRGGTPPFDYNWSVDSLDGQGLLFDLAPGNYFVAVTDAEGCRDTASAVIRTTHSQPQVNISTGGTICVGSCYTFTVDFEGNGPFLLDYEVIAGDLSIPNSIQIQGADTTLEICATDLGMLDEGVITVRLLELRDAFCSRLLDESRDVQVVAGIRSRRTPILCPGGSITINGTVYDADNRSGIEIIPSDDETGCDSIIEVSLHFSPPLTVVSDTTICNLSSETYQLRLEINGFPPLSVSGVPGRIFGNTFVSDPLPSGRFVELEIRDTLGCSIFYTAEGPDCTRGTGCAETFAGTIDTTFIQSQICQFDVFTIRSLGDERLRLNDILIYAVHDGSEDSLGQVLLSNTSMDLMFGLPLEVGVTYHTALIAGRDNGFGAIDFNDPCLSVSLGPPIIFLPAPGPPRFIQGEDTVCIKSNLNLNTELYESDSARYTWYLPDSSTIVTDTNRLVIPNVEEDARGVYQVQVSIGGCSSPIFGPFNFEVIPAPTVDAGPDEILCDQNQIELMAAPINEGTGTWRSLSGVRIEDRNSSLTQVTNLKPGINPFIWQVRTLECVIEDTVLVINQLSPILEDDQEILEQGKERITFDPFRNDQLFGIRCDASTVSIVSQPEIGVVTFLPEECVFEFTAERGIVNKVSFEYTVCSPECTDFCDTAMVTITIPDVFLIYDGIIQGEPPGLVIDGPPESRNNKLVIVNRWGVVVYEKDDYNSDFDPWIGQNQNGDPLPQGPYYMYFQIDGRKEKDLIRTIYLINKRD